MNDVDISIVSNLSAPHSTPILIVDDEPSVRNFLERACTKSGNTVVSAGNATEALARCQQQDIHVAVVDINLPDISGLELCKAMTDEHDIDVVLVTGDEDHYTYETAANHGAVDFLLKPIRLNELDLRLQRALANRQLRLDRDALIVELKRLSITDDLTGLYNARHFFMQLTTEIGRTTRYSKEFSLLILDVDHFKRVNDRLGHLRGDKVLQRIAEAIRQSIRDVDTAYRYGGEEMAVILPETRIESVGVVANRLLENTRFEIPGDDGQPPLKLSVSIGIAHWYRGESPETLIHRADQALYAAKAKGRNRIEFAENKPPEPSPKDAGADASSTGKDAGLR